MSTDTTPTPATAKLQLDPSNPPGPRQLDALKDAARKLQAMSSQTREIWGVRGVSEQVSIVSVLFAGKATWNKPASALAEIVGKFPTLTRANVRDVTAALEAKAAELAKDPEFPTEDKRISPEEHAQRQAQAIARAKAEEDARKVEQSANADIEDKRPPSAAALIVAELDEDQSDSMSDYHGSETIRRCAIGWRMSCREDFKQLRRAAQGFEPTRLYGLDYSPCRIRGVYTDTPTNRKAGRWGMFYPDHLMPGCLGREYETSQAAEKALAGLGFVRAGKVEHGREEWAAPEALWLSGEEGLQAWAAVVHVHKIEHRDNYSMGEGNWVGMERYSGWKVKSYPLPLGSHVGKLEDFLPADDGEPGPPMVAVHKGGYSITERIHTKKGTKYTQVEIDSRVDRAEFERLRDSAKAAGGWYSRQWGKIPGGFAFNARVEAEAWAARELAQKGLSHVSCTECGRPGHAADECPRNK